METGGHLATLQSKEEAVILESLLHYDMYFIGLGRSSLNSEYAQANDPIHL